MKFQIFSIYDNQIKVWHTPWFARSTAEALRSFESMASDPASFIHKFAQYFELHCLGEFEDTLCEWSSGMDKPFGGHTVIAHALQYSGAKVRDDTPL